MMCWHKFQIIFKVHFVAGFIAPYSQRREIYWSLAHFWTLIHNFELRNVFIRYLINVSHPSMVEGRGFVYRPNPNLQFCFTFRTKILNIWALDASEIWWIWHGIITYIFMCDFIIIIIIFSKNINRGSAQQVTTIVLFNKLQVST